MVGLSNFRQCRANQVSLFIATPLHTSSFVEDSPEGMGLYGAAVHKCKFLGVNMVWPAILIMCCVFNSVDGSSEDVDGPYSQTFSILPKSTRA